MRPSPSPPHWADIPTPLHQMAVFYSETPVMSNCLPVKVMWHKSATLTCVFLCWRQPVFTSSECETSMTKVVFPLSSSRDGRLGRRFVIFTVFNLTPLFLLFHLGGLSAPLQLVYFSFKPLVCSSKPLCWSFKTSLWEKGWSFHWWELHCVYILLPSNHHILSFQFRSPLLHLSGNQSWKGDYIKKPQKENKLMCHTPHPT